MSTGEKGEGGGTLYAAADAIAKRLGKLKPRAAIVLGSGLAGVADAVRDAVRIPYKDIPGFPEPGAPGHKAELVGGTLEGVPVVVQSGRFHLYEGHAPDLAALPTRVFARLGATTLVVTNAAGGIRHTFRPPVLMLIADHINLMFKNPLVGPVAEGDERFPDMSDPYDPALRRLARDVARTERIPLEEGVYAGLLGPSFETPAEIRMFRQWGADIIGTPLVPEVILAREAEMCFASIAPIINYASGLAPAVKHTGSGSMVDFYYGSGFHSRVELAIRATLRALPAERACGCGQALSGAFHGTPPEWFVPRG